MLVAINKFFLHNKDGKCTQNCKRNIEGKPILCNRGTRRCRKNRKKILNDVWQSKTYTIQVHTQSWANVSVVRKMIKLVCGGTLTLAHLWVAISVESMWFGCIQVSNLAELHWSKCDCTMHNNIMYVYLLNGSRFEMRYCCALCCIVIGLMSTVVGKSFVSKFYCIELNAKWHSHPHPHLHTYYLASNERWKRKIRTQQQNNNIIHCYIWLPQNNIYLMNFVLYALV